MSDEHADYNCGYVSLDLSSFGRVDLLSVRHINKQACAIIAKSLVRNVALLTIVLTISNTHPITFLMSMSLRLFSDADLPVPPRPCFSQLGRRQSDVLRCRMALCVLIGDRFISEANEVRSCQMKTPVKVMFKAVSKIIIVSAAAGCMPILQTPSSRERAARGATNWKPIIPA
jgi:hypothetical protein